MFRTLPLTILALLSSVGCARMQMSSANLNHVVQFNPTTEPVKKHFRQTEWQHYFLFRLVPTAKPSLEEMISAHAAPGEKIVGLQISKETSFVNGLICVLIGIIYCPEELTIEGDVVATQTR